MPDFVIAELYNKRDRQTSWEEYEMAKTVKFNLICDKKPVRMMHMSDFLKLIHIA